MDRALSLPDLARLSAPAQPLDPIRTRTAPERDEFSSRTRPSPRSPHAGAAIRFGTLEGRDTRPHGARGIAGGICRRRQQHLSANAFRLLAVIGQNLVAGPAEP